MTKIVLVGDLHVSDRAPVHATETYLSDILDQLRWIADYSASIEADAVIWAGDVFHHKSPGRNSHELVLKMIAAVKYFKVPLWCVVGNHDAQNGRVDDVSERQPLGVLFEAGLHELNGWHPSLPVFGIPWRESWTEPGDAAKALEEWRNVPESVFGPGTTGWMQDGYKNWDDNMSKALVVTHAPVFPPGQDESQMFELVPTAGPDGLSAAMHNVGYLYYGHIHEDHGIFEVEGVTYANMGALSRGSLHEYNLLRKIKIAVWTEDGFTEVDVPHKPASEVFKIAEVVEERKNTMSLESFLTAVGQSTLDISSTGSVIEHIQGRTDITPKIKKRAIEILEEVS